MTTSDRPGSRRDQGMKRSSSQAHKVFAPAQADYRAAPTLEVKKRTLENSVLDHEKNNKGGETARTNYFADRYDNPEDYGSLINQNQKSVYVKQRQPSFEKKKNKYGPVNGYEDFNSKEGDGVTGGECVLKNAEKQTLRKLVAMSIKHHDPTLCVCAYCSCGRHLCKIHPWKPKGVKPYSNYMKDYTKKKPFEDLKFRPSTSYKDGTPKIDPLSTYTKDYPPKQSELDPKFLPENLLRTGGPFNELTTYGTGYPGYKAPVVDSIKPIGGDVLHGFPFSGNTSYRKQYTPKEGTRMDPIRTNGNLKLGEPWMGSSTYRDNFVKPNNTYDSGWRSKLSNIPDPKNPNQYDTTYRNDYVPLGSTVCPAIDELTSRSRFFSTSKNPEVFKESKRAMSLIKGV